MCEGRRCLKLMLGEAARSCRGQGRLSSECGRARVVQCVKLWYGLQDEDYFG